MGRPILLDCHLILKCHEPSPERCKVAPDARNVRIQIACVGFERCQILRYRIDIPRRTDVSELPQYKTHWHMLHGCQEGNCNGCGIHFPLRNLRVDQEVPRSKGGTDHLDNLQLLCGAPNSKKGTKRQAEPIAAPEVLLI